MAPVLTYSKGLKEHLGVPAGFEIAAVIPFDRPRTSPGPGEDEGLDKRIHIDRCEIVIMINGFLQAG